MSEAIAPQLKRKEEPEHSLDSDSLPAMRPGQERPGQERPGQERPGQETESAETNQESNPCLESTSLSSSFAVERKQASPEIDPQRKLSNPKLPALDPERKPGKEQKIAKTQTKRTLARASQPAEEGKTILDSLISYFASLLEKLDSAIFTKQQPKTDEELEQEELEEQQRMAAAQRAQLKRKKKDGGYTSNIALEAEESFDADFDHESFEENFSQEPAENAGYADVPLPDKKIVENS